MEGRYDPQRTFAQNVNLTDPILSRFDMLCVLRDESDPVQDEQLSDHVVSSHIRSHPDATAEDKAIRPKLAMRQDHVVPIEQDLLKYYIIYARKNVFPSISGVDMDKVAHFYKDIRAEAFRSGGPAMTARHIDSLVRIAEANARLELRQHVTSRDVDNAIGLMLESFIQSQKHQVAEELRKQFKKYTIQATPLFESFANLLERLFRDKLEQIRAARGEAPELAEVKVDMADFSDQIEANELELSEADTFMRSQRFQRNYRVEGEQICRAL